LVSSFIIVPDLAILTTAKMAQSRGARDHPTLKLLLKAFSHYHTKRKKIISISKDLEKYLLDNGYKSDAKKRQALFSVLAVKEGFECSPEQSQHKLASLLGIQEDDDVYFITDNPDVAGLLQDDKSFSIKTSTEALDLFDD
jgi:hypothetical protein